MTIGTIVTFTGLEAMPVLLGRSWVVEQRAVNKRMVVETAGFDSAGQIGLREVGSPKGSIDLFATRAEVDCG